MLNLMRVELSKLFRGKVLWITVLVYVVSITATFIPLSYTGDLAHLLAVEQVDSTLPESTQELLEEFVQELDAVREGQDNFVQLFYSTSSGEYAVVMVIVTIFIIADAMGGTLQGCLLCGYSRRQLYLAKLLAGFCAGCLYILVSMLNVVLLGVFFFGLSLSAGLLGVIFTILLAQCAVLMEFVAVYTAFAFFFRNGWAFLGSTLFFLLLPSIPLTAAFLSGRDQSYAASFLPGFVSLNGLGSFVSLDAMLARPEQWSPGFLIAALLVLAALTACSTLWGMHQFEKARL